MARISAFMMEPGGGRMPDPAIMAAAVAGTRNIVRWAGLLDGKLEPIKGIAAVDADFPVQRLRTPCVDGARAALYLVERGDIVGAGDPVAEIRDMWGRPLGGLLCSGYDGFFLGRVHGISFYPGDAVLGMAIRDDAPPVAPCPEAYFQD